jgi:predicted nucleic acid-binding protein
VPEFVLDSSVTLAWVFGDESTPYADALLDAPTVRRAIAPVIWPLEVANGLLVAERRGRSTRADTEYCVQRLEALRVAIDDQTFARALRETLPLARTQNLSVYDAAYLELAMRLRIPLATLDGRLRDAAAAVGVPLYVPPAATD